MASNMELKMFASKVSNPWWAVKDDNYVHPDVSNEELFRLSGADFPVELVDLKQYDENFDGYFLLRNQRTGKVLRQCKGRLTPLQSETFFQKITQLGNITDIGAIGQGEKVFFSLDAGSFTIGEGNTHKSFINAVLPHDGTMKVTLGTGDFRIECQNTFNAWKRTLKESSFLAAKQTADCENKIDGWVKVFLEMQDETKTLHENFVELAKKRFSPDTQANLIQKIFDEKENTRSVNQQKMLAQIIGDNASKVTPDLKNTGYDLFNAVTYYTSHESTIKANTERLDTVMFGSAQKFAEKAFNILLNAPADELFDNIIYQTMETSLIDNIVHKAETSETPLLDDILAMA